MLFLLTVAHCSGGHGDTVSVKGIYEKFDIPLELARKIENEKLTMHGLDHGAFIWRLDLNATYSARDYRIVYARRYNGYDKTWKEDWFDGRLENEHSSQSLSAEDIRQSVIGKLI